jgi:hypothetical protein
MARQSRRPMVQFFRRLFGFPAGSSEPCPSCSPVPARDALAMPIGEESIGCGDAEVSDSQTAPGAGCCDADNSRLPQGS